jgi:glycosyltransferase involved in cell wall biosynthesis
VTATAGARTLQVPDRSTDALRLLHLLAPASAGGLESVVRSLARGLTGRGHRVTLGAVVNAGSETHPFIAAARAEGLDVRAIEVSARGYLRERRLIGALVDDLRPSMVHTHGYRPDLVDAGVAARKGVPIVTTIHGFTGGGFRNRLYETLQRRRIRRFDAVIAVSSPMEALLRRGGVPPERLHLIPNAWSGELPLPCAEARHALGLPQGETVLGWVGRLSREKGLDVLIEALPGIPAPVQLSVIGAGPERSRLQELAARLGVTERIRWHGLVGDAGRLIGGFDLLVLSSRSEGTPIVIFEARAAGVPVVATAVGGVPDALAGYDAVLVPAESPVALSGAIRTRLADGRRLQTSPRHWLEAARGEWIDRHETLYRSLVTVLLRESS